MKCITYVVIGWLLVLVVFVPGPMMGQPVVLAGNYNGTDFNGSDYLVGHDSGYTIAWGAAFTVAGTGDFNMTQVTMPLYIPSSFGAIQNPTPDLNHFLVSVVADDGGQPSDNLIGGFTPVGIGSTPANHTYDIAGVLHGGMNYWLIFSPIAQDNGCLGWFFSTPLTSYETGHLAERWSSDGVPTGAWTISWGFGSVRPAFVIEGTAVPEPNSYMLLSLGLIGFAIFGRLCRRTANSSQEFRIE